MVCWLGRELGEYVISSRSQHAEIHTLDRLYVMRYGSDTKKELMMQLVHRVGLCNTAERRSAGIPWLRCKSLLDLWDVPPTLGRCLCDIQRL